MKTKIGQIFTLNYPQMNLGGDVIKKGEKVTVIGFNSNGEFHVKSNKEITIYGVNSKHLDI